MKLLRKKLFTAAAAVLMSQAAFAEVNMAGKTIEWTIPFSETGGSAKWANFFAPLLSDALPGNPTVVVKFMPGAGSTKGANWFQRQKHTDGTVMFGSSGSTQFPYLLDDPRVQYEYNDWVPVMASGTGGVAYLNAEAGAKFDGSANNLKDIQFVYGNQGATRLDLVPAMAWDMLGMKVNHVMGIKGRGDGRKMFESGEANIDYQTSAGYLKGSKKFVDDGTAVAMMTWGALDDEGNIVRDPTFPDIPTFKEVCEKTAGCDVNGKEFKVWKAFFVSGFPVQKLAFLPAGTPKEVSDTYAAAFEKIRNRPDFAALAEKRLGKYPLFVGAGAQKAMKVATDLDPEAKKYAIQYLKDRFNVSLK